MDPAIKPGDDFFGYASGKWAARTEIPSDRTRFGNFDKLSVLSEHRVHAIAMDAAAGKLSDPDAAKIGTVRIDSPAVIDHPLEGDVYLATPHQNPFGSLLAIYIAVNDSRTGVVVKTGPYDMIEVNITANPTFTSKIVRCIQAATDNYSMSVYPGEIFSTLETTDWEPIVRRVISIGGPAEKEIPLLDDESAVYTISRS